MLNRLPLYEPAIDDALKAENIPAWIKYLPLAESRLKPQAVSPAGAAGLWQIMPRTAKSLGLRITPYLDERLDTKKASAAAAKYLRKLHNQFDDWLLALAAYNCGAGNVRKAQRRANAYFYHEISRFLPRQTRRYIPRVLTIASIGTDPASYGFELNQALIAPVEVILKASSTFSELALYYGVSSQQIADLNPAFLSRRIYANEGKPASIYIPALDYHYGHRLSILEIRSFLEPTLKPKGFFWKKQQENHPIAQHINAEHPYASLLAYISWPTAFVQQKNVG